MEKTSIWFGADIPKVLIPFVLYCIVLITTTRRIIIITDNKNEKEGDSTPIITTTTTYGEEHFGIVSPRHIRSPEFVKVGHKIEFLNNSSTTINK